MIQFKQLQGWQGRVSIDGTEYDSVNSVPESIELKGATINLLPKVEKRRVRVEDVTSSEVHLITVKQWMTQPSTPEFDYMARFNKDIPMPLKTMEGTIEKETEKSVYMHLHGSVRPTIRCMRCGKELTNPVSRKYFLGIECIQKVGIIRDVNDIEGIKEDLVKTEWTGWIPRSAIISDEIVDKT